MSLTDGSMKASKGKVFSLLLTGIFLFSFGLVSASPAYDSIDVTPSIFLILFVGSLVFVLIGVLARSPLFSIAGMIGILITGFLMLQGHILLPNGATEVVAGNVTTITPVYENWDYGNNELFGFFIILVSAGLLWTLPFEFAGDGDG